MKDRASLAAAFGAAAAYDQHGAIQRAVAQELARRIAALPVVSGPLAPHPQALEVGCGTGFLGEALMPLVPQAHWVMSDLAPPMLERARLRLGEGLRYHAMDGEFPDLDGPFDLIVSSLAFQWFGDLAAAVARYRARLAPAGWLAFTTLVEGSFAQWRAAHGALPCGVPDYPAAAALARLGLAVEVLDLPFTGGGRAFLRHLHGIGARLPRAGHRPLSPTQLKQVIARFDAAGGVATYRVAICILRGPAS